MNARKRIRTVWIVMIAITMTIVSTSMYFAQKQETTAATFESADIRFIFTTDLHGRLTPMDYELGEPYNTGSLAKAYTLIQDARAEKKEGNSFTFDVGDVLYDYTTENIFEMDPKAIQPMFQAMRMVNYDAIVLGNHEFDYGYDYIMKQIQGAGLMNKCVVSNLKDAKTGKSVFQENKIISREVTTKSGKKVTLDIGIIGETIPILSKKRENYIGELVAEDIIANATEQAKKLKKEGADIIVVLAHSGMGSETPTEFSKDVSYALTKIKEVDVVLCGHEHNLFPSTNAKSSKYYELSGVNKKNGLVNGKNLVMVNDKGQNIGIVDMTVKVSGSKKTISKRSSAIRPVRVSTEANAEITATLGKWQEVFDAATNNIIGNVADGKSLNNFLGLVEDTSSMQILNNSKIYYALQYINTKAVEYQGYPVIAASNHVRYGQLSAQDYANLTGEVSEANISAIAPFNKYVFLYEVNGKQVKEWLEWSASAYQTLSQSVTWTDEAMNAAISASGAQSLLSEEWFDEWGSFYVFDGIDYTFDPSVEPRYDYNGNKINQTNRVSSITYNGTPVTDSTKFVLATDPLTNVKKDALAGIENQSIVKGINKSITILAQYMSMLSKSGDFVPYSDDNWRVSLPANYNFVLKTSQNARAEINQNNWVTSLITNTNEMDYYKVQFNRNETDTTGPNLVIAPTNDKPTHQSIKIAVSAFDASGIKDVRYAYGDYNEYYSWQYANEFKGTFAVGSNGIYTVYAQDNNNNVTIKKVNITNINQGILQVPTVNSYTNRTTKITGKAEPSSTIYFKTVEGNYETTVNANGSFSYELPPQRAGDSVSIYIKDNSGRNSDTVTVPVKRTGPNRPIIDNIDNTALQLTGNTNADTVAQIFVVAGDKVYVSPNGGKAAYQSCDKYVSSYEIVETPIQILNDGRFFVDTNGINGNTLVTVYSYDFANRLSKANMSRVQEIGPNPPILYSVSNAENMVSGRIYNKNAGTTYNVTLTVGGQTYTAVTDAKGYFDVNVDILEAGQAIKVYATDVVDNVTRTSAEITKNVQDINAIIKSLEYQYMFLNDLDNKSTSISGTCLGGNETIIIRCDDELYEVQSNEDGDFLLELPSTLKAGTVVTAVYREQYTDAVDADQKIVTVGKPEQPEIKNATIYNTTKLIRVLTKEKGSVTIEVGEDVYKSKDYVYDEALGYYVFDVTINNVDSGNYISIYSSNSAGDSPKLDVPVVERAPNTPKIKDITTNTDVIKGTVNLLLDTKDQEGKTPTVENTGTKVYVKTSKKTYTAVISDDGSFEVKIPKQKAKTKMTIWGINSLGKGPSMEIIVKKAK